MYCSTDDVFRTAGITSTEISADNVTQFILEAEEMVDRLTNTTYWSLKDSGTADAGAGDNELDDATKAWIPDNFVNNICWIYSGTGSGQARLITDSTATKLTVESNWTTNPDATSLYRVIHTGKDAHKSSETYEGDDTDTLFLDKYPLIILEDVTIDSTSVTTSYVYKYEGQGKLVLGTSDVEVDYWTSKKAQKNVVSYWWGVYPLPLEARRLTQIYASIMCLEAQMGGTHNIPSTYSLPEGSVTIGQAYINIKGTWDTLMKEKANVELRIIKYTVFA